MDKIGKVFLTLIAVGWLLIALAVVSGCNNECPPGAGSCIPIEEEPTCVDLVTDECIPEVVDAFCEVCETCDYTGFVPISVCDHRVREAYQAGKDSVVCDNCEDAYYEGFRDGVNSVEPEYRCFKWWKGRLKEIDCATYAHRGYQPFCEDDDEDSDSDD